MQRSKYTTGLAIIVCCLGSGCGDLEEPAPTHETANHALFVDDDMDGATGTNEGVIHHQQWQAAQYLGGPTGHHCSATYLKRNSLDDPPMVMTAAHCVIVGPNQLMDPEHASFVLYYDDAQNPASGATSITKRRYYPAAEVLAHPGRVGGSLYADVALITLREVPRLLNGQELEGAELLQRLPQTGTGAHQGNPGDHATMVGAGGISNGSSFSQDGKRRTGRTYLTGLQTNSQGVLIKRSGEIWGTNNQTKEIRYGATGYSGDSGGPLYIRDNGVEKLAGVACCGLFKPDPTDNDIDIYWAGVYNHPSNPNKAWIDANRLGSVGAHGFDDNDTVRNPSGELLTLPKASTHFSDLGSKVDEDMYLLGWYGPGHQIRMDLFFSNADLDIDVAIVSGEWQYKIPPEIDQWTNVTTEQLSQSVTDNEHISFSTTKSYRPYYLRIFAYPNHHPNNDADYRFIRCDGDGYSNINFANAETLTGPVSDRTACGGLNRYFAFTKQPNQNTLTITFDRAYGDLDAVVYDTNENVLISGNYGGSNEVLDINNLTNGSTYYLKVFDYQGINGNTFGITFQ